MWKSGVEPFIRELVISDCVCDALKSENEKLRKQLQFAKALIKDQNRKLKRHPKNDVKK